MDRDPFTSSRSWIVCEYIHHAILADLAVFMLTCRYSLFWMLTGQISAFDLDEISPGWGNNVILFAADFIQCDCRKPVLHHLHGHTDLLIPGEKLIRFNVNFY